MWSAYEYLFRGRVNAAVYLYLGGYKKRLEFTISIDDISSVCREHTEREEAKWKSFTFKL